MMVLCTRQLYTQDAIIAMDMAEAIIAAINTGHIHLIIKEHIVIPRVIIGVMTEAILLVIGMAMMMDIMTEAIKITGIIINSIKNYMNKQYILIFSQQYYQDQ